MKTAPDPNTNTYSLKMTGTIHNRPTQFVHTTISWPNGVCWEEVSKKLIAFRTAFDYKSYTVTQ